MEETLSASAGHAISLREQGNTLVAHLMGVIDICVAEELHEKSLELARSARNIVLELDEAECLDASALRVLVALQREVIRHGRLFSVTGCGEIRNYLEIAGMLGLLFESEVGATPSRQGQSACHG
jgi:anti-anti-sigma factor